MKITLEHYDQKISVEHVRDDLTIFEVAEMLNSLLLGASFTQDTIDEVLNVCDQ